MIRILVFNALIFFTQTIRAQSNVLDTLHVNGTCKSYHLYRPAPKMPTADYLMSIKDSVWYCNKGYLKPADNFYIIMRDTSGIMLVEGEFFDIFPNGFYKEYDKLGRLTKKGIMAFQPEVKKRKKLYIAHSKFVETTYFYDYKDKNDQIGYLKKTIEWNYKDKKSRKRIYDFNGNLIDEEVFIQNH
jgi:hypothetical protein